MTPNGMHTLRGWREVSCREADLIRRQGAGLTVASTLTDPDGNFGSPIVFTEWWWGDTTPVLRDYRYPKAEEYRAGCTHFIAHSSDAAHEEDES